jgi:hypothetical protein
VLLLPSNPEARVLTFSGSRLANDGNPPPAGESLFNRPRRHGPEAAVAPLSPDVGSPGAMLLVYLLGRVK